MMPVIYIAGPYRHATEWGVTRNIRAAELVAVEVWQAGAVALCPHLNGAHLGGCVADDDILAGDRELLKRADAVLMIGSWETSEGARLEHDFAREIGQPIFYDLDHMRRWVDERRGHYAA